MSSRALQGQVHIAQWHKNGMMASAIATFARLDRAVSHSPFGSHNCLASFSCTHLPSGSLLRPQPALTGPLTAPPARRLNRS